MSTEYFLKVKRKKDNKELASFYCNELKNIFDSEFAKFIKCENDYIRKGVKFTYSELESVKKLCQQKLDSISKQIFEKKLLIALAKNKDIKQSIEDDIFYLETDESEQYKYCYDSCCYIMGSIMCVTECLFKKNKPAYEYNSVDGHGYCSVDDIYCEIDY